MLSVFDQPPYVEVYKHAPLMLLKLSNAEKMCNMLPPKKWVLLCHSVHRKIDAAVAAAGLFKIGAAMQGMGCLFTTSPGLPATEQVQRPSSCLPRML